MKNIIILYLFLFTLFPLFTSEIETTNKNTINDIKFKFEEDNKIGFYPVDKQGNMTFGSFQEGLEDVDAKTAYSDIKFKGNTYIDKLNSPYQNKVDPYEIVKFKYSWHYMFYGIINTSIAYSGSLTLLIPGLTLIGVGYNQLDFMGGHSFFTNFGIAGIVLSVFGGAVFLVSTVMLIVTLIKTYYYFYRKKNIIKMLNETANNTMSYIYNKELDSGNTLFQIDL